MLREEICDLRGGTSSSSPLRSHLPSVESLDAKWSGKSKFALRQSRDSCSLPNKMFSEMTQKFFRRSSKSLIRHRLVRVEGNLQSAILFFPLSQSDR